MRNIVKVLFVFIFLFSTFAISNATGNNPRAYNSSAKKVASPSVVRKALNIKYSFLKKRYCSDYRKSGNGVTARCRGSFHLSKSDLNKTKSKPKCKNCNKCSSKKGNLPKAHNWRAKKIATPSIVRKALNKKYPALKKKYCNDYRASRNGSVVVRCKPRQYRLYKNDLYPKKVKKCGIDLYKSGTSCLAVGTGYYSPVNNDTRYACTNAPVNTKYTSDGNGTNNCSWTCNTNYHQENNTCVDNTKSCTIDNGTGTQTWTGSSWGTCTVVSCNTGYQKSGNSCTPVPVNQAPTANAGADKTITEGESVTLNGSGTDTDGTIVKYEWFLGTNLKYTGQNYSISGLTVGTYTYTLKVTDDDGATDTDSVIITVEEAGPSFSTIANITIGDEGGVDFEYDVSQYLNNPNGGVYSITGPDASKIEQIEDGIFIDANTGVLSGYVDANQDYPNYDGDSNDYTISITYTKDGVSTTSNQFVISIEDEG